MSKKLKLFEDEEFTFKDKFYSLMDLLVTNQSSSAFQSYLLLGIFYLQIISLFFTSRLKVLNPNDNKSDYILNIIEKIIRIKDLINPTKMNFQIMDIFIFVLVVLVVIHFIINCASLKKDFYYSSQKNIINYYIKIFLYIGYNIILDITLYSFEVKVNTISIIFSVLIIIFAVLGYIFINIFYNDSFYLFNSYFSKMSCNYDVYWGLNCFAMSILAQISSFPKEIFLFYNLIVSIIMMAYFIRNYLYYDQYINIFTGVFHLIYLWTSIFSIVFCYLDLKEKGIIYIFTCISVPFFYRNIKNRIESNIFLKTPFYKITNPNYILYYFKTLYELTNNPEENYQSKSLLSGIIKMHEIECPNPTCILKTNESLFLPITNKFDDKNKKKLEDEVFLKNFLIIVMNYFIYAEKCSADMYLNLSLYYLKVIGNYCQAIYFFRKVAELSLTLREKFSFVRLKAQISKTLVEKLKPPNEQCNELENLDVSMYFKYEELSENFFDEIGVDVNLSLDFWKEFQSPYKEPSKRLDFNKIFDLTDKIGKTKKNIETMWSKLLEIYSGVNNFFELYSEYVEQINDDDLKKRDLEGLRRKNDASNDHLNNKFYSLLFNKNTGIIIANGDKGKEGVIEFANKEIENIFKYRTFDLKGMNLTTIMPKMYEKEHSKYIENYFKIGQKRVIDKSDFKAFAKDKDNSIIKIGIAIKLFPILNDNVLFTGLINKENIDDIIFLDDKFNIQGMSLKLMKILNIGNKNLFQENEIPFYVICRKFVNFYSIFLQRVKKEVDADKELQEMEQKENKEKDAQKEDIHENIEINENVELEYEIKLPQFLVDYADKSKKEEHEKMIKLLSTNKNSALDSEVLGEEYEEDELLLENEESKTNVLSVTPTPMGETPTPMGDGTPISDETGDNSSQNMIIKKENETEKQYNTYMAQYKKLFEEGKMSELEELIDNCNKNSKSIEYKFNFTFDKYKYGEKKVSFIVRCIDNKNDFGKSEEESAADLDPKNAKYKKEKADAIKPLFELYEEERKEILGLPEIFLNLSIENKKFQKLLQACKNDINILSKTHGQKKDEVLEDENSSQSSQTGFDSGLVKKNRIEEIRNNLMKNISNYPTLKYIKNTLLLIFLATVAYIVIFVTSIFSIHSDLFSSTKINMNLFQTTLWTTELVNIFISLRELFYKERMNYTESYYTDANNVTHVISMNYTYNDYLTNGKNVSLFYDKCVGISLELCDKLTASYGYLEMEIPKYLKGDDLNRLYWNKFNISYFNERYNIDNKTFYNETFPLAIAQIISNAFSFLKSSTFNSLNPSKGKINLYSDNYYQYLYSTYIVIENGKKNVIPDQFNKIVQIPKILKEYNLSKMKGIDTLMSVFSIVIGLLCVLNYVIIHYTYSSMLDGMEKITKIKLEKIEEILKRITNFGANLKKLREKEQQSDDNKENGSNIYDGESVKSNRNDNNEERNKKKMDNLVNNNGFINDTQKYIPLTVLHYIFIYSLCTTVFVLIYLIPCYYYILSKVKKTNELILAQNYIFEKLIISSSHIADVKCFISGCGIHDDLDTSELADYSIIHDIIKGLNLFPKISEFYNEKFLLNACKTAFTNETSEEYLECSSYNNSLILAAINTENLLKLIDDLIFNIKNGLDSNTPLKKILFSSTDYNQMDTIFFRYFLTVEKNFVDCILIDLNDSLNSFYVTSLILLASFGAIIIIYYITSRILLIRNLIHHLSISRMIMKIIPTSVIISTPDLETWIESKY